MVKAFRRTAPRPYHHGNLAPALVEAALTLLNETQDWDFSLREVARRAGVSHNAPYKHFQKSATFWLPSRRAALRHWPSTCFLRLKG